MLFNFFCVLILSICSITQSHDTFHGVIYSQYQNQEHAPQQKLPRSVSIVTNYEPSLVLTPCQIRMINFAYQQKYGKTFEDIWGKGGLFSIISYEDVFVAIATDVTLNAEQSLNLWQGYCDKRVVGTKYKVLYKQKLNNIVQKKSRPRKNRIAFYDKHVDELNTILSKYSCGQHQGKLRDAALKKTKAESYHQHLEKHELQPLTLAFLKHRSLDDIDYTFYYGTALQQQFHTELCNVLDKAAFVHMQKYYPKNVLDSSLYFAQAAYEANEQELPALVAALLYISQSLLHTAYESAIRYFPAALEGMKEAGGHALYMAMHPKQSIEECISDLQATCCGIGSALWYALDTAALVYSSDAYPELWNKVDNRVMQVRSSLSHIIQQAQSMSGPDLIKALSKYGTECFILGKCVQGIQSLSRKAKYLKYAKSSQKEYVIQELVANADQAIAKQVLHQAIETEKPKYRRPITSSVVHKNYQLINTMKGLIKNAQTFEILVEELKPILKKIKQYGGYIPKYDVELVKNAKIILSKLEKSIQLKNFEALSKVYGRRIINNTQINASLNHIFSFECTLQASKKLGGYVIRVDGGHLYGMCELLEEVGIVSIVDKDILPSGVVHYSLRYVSSGEDFVKTVCPMSWDAEKMSEVIWHVYEYGEDIVTQVGNKFKVKKIENVDISLPLKEKFKDLDNKNLNTVQILSLLPYKISKK